MKNALVIISLVVLSACSSKSDDANRLTTKQVHALHQQNKVGNRIDEARKSWVNQDSGNARSFNSDLRLSNPELNAFVFPARNDAGSVRPGYYMKFSMYSKVHYKLGN